MRTLRTVTIQAGAVALSFVALLVGRSVKAPASCLLLAIMAVALYGGKRAAQTAFVVSTVLFALFVLPTYAILLHARGGYLRLVFFVIPSLIILALVDARDRHEKTRRRIQAEFQAVVETSPDCILLVDNAHEITFINPVGERLLGITKREILGEPISLILSGVGPDHPPYGEFSLKADGRELIVDATCGRFAETTTIFLRDTTERKLNEVRLHESEARLRRTIDTIPGFVTEAEADGTLIFASARFIEYFGYSEGEAIVQTATCRHVHPDQAQGIAEIKKQGYRSGQPFTFQQRVRRHDGVYRWFQVAAQPLTDSAGQVARWYSLHTDIDDLVLAQDSIQRLQVQLALANQIATASELAASIVHEISQPVSAMVTNGQVGLNFLLNEPPNVKDSLLVFTRIIEDGKTTAAIVSGLASLFNRSTPEMKPISIKEIVGEILVLLRGRLLRSGVTMKDEVLSDLPLVNGGKIALQQVFINLLNNALDAVSITPHAKLVMIRSTFRESIVSIVIEDGGVRPVDYEEIFVPFFTTKAKGMGLGLPIARSIIEAHGGTLSARAKTNGFGSIFEFTLPVWKREERV